MRNARYATSRQKACRPCSEAKAKCDRQTGTCARCALRGLTCVYPQPATTTTRQTRSVGKDEAIAQSFASQTHPTSDALTRANGAIAAMVSPPATNNVSYRPGQAAIVGPLPGELICPIDADAISVRWMHPYIPVPGQAIKTYAPATMGFIQRVLRSYASVAVRGRGVPPFVHASQLGVCQPTGESLASLVSPSISACLRLLRIADGVVPGSDDAIFVAGVLMREMDALHDRHERLEKDKGGEPGTTNNDNDDGSGRLAAFQAYLLYVMVLVFCVDPGGSRTRPFLRHAVVALQQMAGASVRDGLVCAAEQQKQQQQYQKQLRRGWPSWAAWAAAEAKRRTLFTLYLADSALAAQDGLPTFMGTELRGLPAPASGALWTATTLAQWEAAYDAYAADWLADGQGSLRIDELWRPPADIDAAGVALRNQRIDRWLEGVDAFGTMMYAVTSHTHSP